MAGPGKKYVGAVDQGTTSSRFIVFDQQGKMVSSHQLEHRQIYPQPGYVEHDPVEIWARTGEVVRAAMRRADIEAGDMAAIGITNQRETVVVWNPKTGEPYYNAIVWQDLRTAAICDAMGRDGGQDRFREKTGLPLATYFSGPKIKWLLDHDPRIRRAADAGEAILGTIDTWLIWQLTGGSRGGVHVTDVTNASRTMLMDLATLDWDDGILEALDIPKAMLPRIRPSSDPTLYGYTAADGPFGGNIPVAGNLGDQQAALFGQACYDVGEAKNTYGTGCFLLMNTGRGIVPSRHGLLTTVGYKIGSEPAVYALEGSVAIAGSLIQWVRDKLQLIRTAPEINELAETVADNGGVYFVPAFTGLFAPYWRSDARGLIMGITHYVTNAHIARAVLEATAFQTREIFEAMQKDSGIALAALKVDGGMVASETLMQFQADLLGVSVTRPVETETTALGSAYAAGLAVGFWKDIDELKKHWMAAKRWEPQMAVEKRELLFGNWRKAVERTLNWIDP
jgi:glycerol kinase